MFILELNQEGMGTEIGLFRTIEEGRAFIVPLTKFMFTEEGDIDIFWKELPDLSAPGKGMVEGSTRVDAYSIENRDLKDYIEKRESQYRKVKAFLEAKGYEADRAYFGSEDGEAVLYRKKGSKDWHFLSHMDPDFIEEEDFPSLLD